MIQLANEMGVFTIPYVFGAEDARVMALAGADAIVCHLGLTVKGDSEATISISLEDAVRKVQDICAAAKTVKADIICLCHGGPISTPEDAEYVLRKVSGITGSAGPRAWSACRPSSPSRRRSTNSNRSSSAIHNWDSRWPMGGNRFTENLKGREA